MKTSDLAPNPRNPRVATEAKLDALKKALFEFGDISGIVYNRKTKQLVGGHQRLKQFDDDSLVEIVRTYKKPTRTGTVAEGFIELGGERFNYREVVWPKHKEMAANLAANKGAGEWNLPELGDWMKELNAFDVQLDVDLTMFDEDERDDLPTGEAVPRRTRAVGTTRHTHECPKCGHEWSSKDAAAKLRKELEESA